MSDIDTFAENTLALLDAHGGLLLSIARASIEAGLESGQPIVIDAKSIPDALMENGAAFVTLKNNNGLRGCIGSADARQPLAIDVADNAFRAAFSDPRFAALSIDETKDGLRLSISVLSPASEIDFKDEEDLLAILRPGVDGLIIEDGPSMRALFLPAVWQQLENPSEFLAHLKIKAGMSSDHFSPTFRAYRFIAGEVKSDWDAIPPLN